MECNKSVSWLSHGNLAQAQAEKGYAVCSLQSHTFAVLVSVLHALRLVTVHSLVWTLTKRFQVVIDGPQ